VNPLTAIVVSPTVEQILRVDKRNKFEIYCDILDAIKMESSDSTRFSLTRVARHANLPYNRFQKTINMLMSLDLCLRDGGVIVVTEKGQEYISEYKKIDKFFRRMGFYY
jgi:predicted transcriptional regulator